MVFGVFSVERMSHLMVVLIAMTATASAASHDLAKATNAQNLMASKDVDAAAQKLNLPVLKANKNNICLGKIDKGDILLAKASHIKKPCRNKVHVQDIIIKGKKNVGITAIQVTEVGGTQNSAATIKEGGVGQDYVVIRLQSAKGGGYHYVSEVWGEKLENDNFMKRQKFKSLILISGS